MLGKHHVASLLAHLRAHTFSVLREPWTSKLRENPTAPAHVTVEGQAVSVMTLMSNKEIERPGKNTPA